MSGCNTVEFNSVKLTFYQKKTDTKWSKRLLLK